MLAHPHPHSADHLKAIKGIEQRSVELRARGALKRRPYYLAFLSPDRP